MNHDWIQEAAREILKPVADYAHGYRLHVPDELDNSQESLGRVRCHNDAIDMVVMQFQDPNDTVDLEREIAAIISRHLSGTEQSEIAVIRAAEKFRCSQNPKLVCPNCGKRSHKYMSIWNPWSDEDTLKCTECGKWAMNKEWMALLEEFVAREFNLPSALSPTSDANKESK